MREKDQQQALFWCKLLYAVIFEELEKGEIKAYVENLSKQEVEFPNGERKKPGLSTLWGKIKAYRTGGFEALARKSRKDIGGIRAVDQEIIDKAIELKKDQPRRSDKIINIFLQEYYGKTISKSTLYRHLRQAGATRIKLGISKKKVRCRWTRQHTHSLWLGDFEHGPRVLIEGHSYKTYLSAFIDCHSRYIVDARYYLRENLAVLEDSLLRAWNVHGVPLQIHLDNAKVYCSKALQSACLSLGIQLLYRPPREPESGGKIEKFFQTVQSQFESEIRASSIIDLDQLNRKFSAWLCQCYHQTTNSETKETPQESYNSGLTAIRKVDVNSVIKYFYKCEQRTVHKDFSDISIYGKFYKVDKRLRGDRIKIYFDQFTFPPETVLLYSLLDQYIGKGKLHQRQKEQELSPPATQTRPKHDLLSILVDRHENLLNKQIQGLDYCKAVADHHWPFLSFIQALAKLLGRKGGSSSFTSEEHQSLEKIYNTLPNLTESFLEEAFEMAEEKTIVYIAFQLQSLTARKV